MAHFVIFVKASEEYIDIVRSTLYRHPICANCENAYRKLESLKEKTGVNFFKELDWCFSSNPASLFESQCEECFFDFDEVLDKLKKKR